MIRVIFYNAKSNVGKSFLTMRIGQYLKERFEQEVLIVDYTKNQTLSSLRKSESELYPGIDKKDLVEIKTHNSYDEYLEKEQYYKDSGIDVVLFDANCDDISDIGFIMQSQYVFIVSDFQSEDEKSYKLDRAFFMKMSEAKVSNVFPLQQVKVISNMTDNTYHIEDCDIDILDSKIPLNKRDYGNLSTIGRLGQSANKNFKTIASEIYSIIKNDAIIEVL